MDARGVKVYPGVVDRWPTPIDKEKENKKYKEKEYCRTRGTGAALLVVVPLLDAQGIIIVLNKPAVLLSSWG